MIVYIKYFVEAEIFSFSSMSSEMGRLKLGPFDKSSLKREYEFFGENLLAPHPLRALFKVLERLLVIFIAK